MNRSIFPTHNATLSRCNCKSATVDVLRRHDGRQERKGYLSCYSPAQNPIVWRVIEMNAWWSRKLRFASDCISRFPPSAGYFSFPPAKTQRLTTQAGVTNESEWVYKTATAKVHWLLPIARGLQLVAFSLPYARRKVPTMVKVFKRKSDERLGCAWMMSFGVDATGLHRDLCPLQ